MSTKCLNRTQFGNKRYLGSGVVKYNVFELCNRGRLRLGPTLPKLILNSMEKDTKRRILRSTKNQHKKRLLQRRFVGFIFTVKVALDVVVRLYKEGKISANILIPGVYHDPRRPFISGRVRKNNAL